MKEPLYKQIMNNLKKQILSGQLPTNSQLPTENELSETYQVSRITSKRALSELEQAGLINRTRGKGSFVKDTAIHDSQQEPNKSYRILFLLPFIHDLSLGDFTKGLLPIAQNNQIEVVMGSPEFFLQKTANELMSEYVGLIYYAENDDPYLDLLVELSLNKFPVVSLDKKIFELDFPTVSSDNVAGGKLAAQSLINQGHTQIAYVFGQETHPQTVRDRYIGYLTALNSAKLNFQTSSINSNTTIKDLLNYVKETKVTALVCENDLIAIEAMHSLKQEGYLIPEDFSIVGFDNIQTANFVEPPLTTIAQDFEKIGQIAGQTLIEWIENKQRPKDVKVPVHLIKRKSTIKK